MFRPIQAMAFAQLTYLESLRDIETCLTAKSDKLYHMGFRSLVKRSTLADANENRDWRIYHDLGQILISRARSLYNEEIPGLEGLAIHNSNTVYALDSTTIDLCLSLFQWAPFRHTKAAVKMHTLLDLQGNIPSFIHIPDGKEHDVNVLDQLIPESGAIDIMDRAYLDLERLFMLKQSGAFFVIRTKSNTKLYRLFSAPHDRVNGIISDQIARPVSEISQNKYPEHLRRIRYKDPEKGETIVFLTNMFDVSHHTICKLYKTRWQVELFFKWIKQHLRIKKLHGNSENAVKTQLWIAVSIYVLVAIMKNELSLKISLYSFLQILSVPVFEKTLLNTEYFDIEGNSEDNIESKQLNLFGFSTGH